MRKVVSSNPGQREQAGKPPTAPKTKAAAPVAAALGIVKRKAAAPIAAAPPVSVKRKAAAPIAAAPPIVVKKKAIDRKVQRVKRG